MPYKDPKKNQAAKRRWIERNREKYAAMQKSWADRNPDKLVATRARYHAKNPGLRRRMKLREYSLTEGAYLAIYNAQAGLCAICFTCLDLLDDKHRHIDHDHTTGAVRGILCRGCNLGLGNFKDDTRSLASAIAYLQRSRR